MTAFWIVNSEKKTNTHISKPDLYFAVTSPQYTVSMHGYVSYSPETASKYSLVITNQRDSLIMYEGSDSFGECHSETLVSLHPASPCGRHKSELRQDFQSSVFLCCLISISSLFLSFRPPSRAALQLWPHFLGPFPAFCLNPADSTATQVTHEYCIIVRNSSSAWSIFFFFLWNGVCVAEFKCQQDQNTPAIIKLVFS